MRNTFYHEEPAAAPILFRLESSIASCEDMFTRLDFTLAQARGALAVTEPPVIDDSWDDDDTAWGDVHGLPESFFSWVEAAGEAFYLEGRGVYLEPAQREDGRFVLVFEREARWTGEVD